ncbi:predicted protein [Naegleria gruberi]|uniref:Predicted protein n=1 Tax=Naegleria gruberi TaxID=5762 RepID=D2V279_NAEGR|nr:uncharacterized protein NAEGRDRAFT_62909 [Naegleria gruberi]EFC49007.1 predicted protein [Naegleria gruberi]|eukprot:XP_002681751.1 predicted protein [Naegleria gruberi strain NEG-M]
MASRHRDFKIKAWPFVSHTSNVDRSETDIMWPLIRYERYGTRKKFSIRPFLFKYESDSSTNALTIMFLFYSILYKVSIDAVTLFLLPFLTFHRKSKTSQTTMILAGLLYFLRKTFHAAQETKFMAILPFMYFSNESKRTDDNNMSFQTLFPFFWKYKTKETHLNIVLPFYFLFENGKFRIRQMWPFFGTQLRPGKYQEWSILYPLFRVRKGEGNFTLHMPWPFLKYERSPEKHSLRFLPICWIRFLKKGGSRGFVLFFYWKHVSSKNCSPSEPAKFTFGIWGLLHIKISLDKGESKGHHIFWIFLLFFYFKNSEKVYTFITPFFMHAKYEKQLMKRRIYLFPFFYYSKYHDHDWHLFIPLLFTYFKKTIYNYSTSKTSKTFFTTLLLFWFHKSKYETEGTTSTDYNNVFLPFYWVRKDIGIRDGKTTDDTTKIFLIPLLFYFFKENIDGREDIMVNLFYLFYYRNQKSIEKMRVWLFPIFYYSDIGKEKTFLLFVLLYARRSEEKNYLSILIIYSKLHKKQSHKLVTYPFFLYITYTSYKQTDEVLSHTRLFVGGLFGHRKIYDEVTIWLFVCYYSFVSKNESIRMGSFFFLPPYFYHSVEDGKVTMSTIFPFYVYNRYWKYTFIFPFFFIRNDRRKKSAHLHFIFDLSIDSQDKNYYFKLFYIPRTRYSLIQYDSKYVGSAEGTSMMRRWRLFAFPFFYFEKRALETPDLTSSETKQYAPLITVALFWLLKDLSLGRIILDYREMIKSMYILPLFYIKIDRNNQVVNALRNGQYLSFSLIYFISEKVALFRYTRLITPNSHRSSMYVFLLFFSTVKNWWTGHGEVVGNDFTLSFLWIFRQGWSFIYWNQQYSTDAYNYLCCYVLPLFYFDKQTKTTTLEEVFERSFSLLWILHKTAALFTMDKVVNTSKESNQITKSDTSSFLFPIYYYSCNDSNKVWKWLWLPAPKTWGVSIINWIVEYEYSTYKPIDQRKIGEQRLHISPLYYRDIKYDLTQPSKTVQEDVHYGFWFFTKNLSLIRAWSLTTTSNRKQGFYIFLVILKYTNVSGTSLRKTFCLVWMFTKWLALFHNNVLCTQPSVSMSTNTDDYSNKNHRQFVMSLYFYKHMTGNIERREFSLFWLFYKYVTFFCVWKYENEQGWFAYPLVFYRAVKTTTRAFKFLSVLFLVEKYVSVFFWRCVVEGNRKKILTYLFPIFFLERERESVTLETKTHLFMLWLFYKRIAMAHYWKLFANGHTDSGFYSFPLVRYTNDSSGEAGKKFDISIFYFFHKNLAIIYFGKDRTRTYCDTMFYIFPLFIHQTKDHSSNLTKRIDWSIFFLFYYKLALVRYWNIVTFISNVGNKTKSTQDLCFYIFMLYSFTKEFASSKTTLTHSFAWLFHPLLSTLRFKLSRCREDFSRLFYIFPLILFHSSKEGGTSTFYLSLLWLFHKFVSMFHFGRQVFGDGHILAGGASDNKDSKITSFILFLYFYASDTRVKEKKWSLFWLFVRQVSFIRYSKSLKEGHKLLKFLVFPFFKFERWSTKSSRWCLLPFVPVKFSWVANFMVYTKRVNKVGAVLDDGKEDKSSRDQNRYLRVLYKVVVWQYVDQVKSLEINPFFASEHDYTDGYKSWDILGGCLGRVKNSPEHQDACRLFCCCFV